jgi:hypothetical protein
LNALALLPLLALQACGSVTFGPHEPAPATGRDITTWVVDLEHRAGHELRLRNDSDTAFRIRSITLRECTNLEEPCAAHELNRLVCPGESVVLLTVHPRDRMKGVWFDWGYDALRYFSIGDVVGANCPGRTASRGPA